MINSPTKNLLDYSSPLLIPSQVYCFGFLGAFGLPSCYSCKNYEFLRDTFPFHNVHNLFYVADMQAANAGTIISHCQT